MRSTSIALLLMLAGPAVAVEPDLEITPLPSAMRAEPQLSFDAPARNNDISDWVRDGRTRADYHLGTARIPGTTGAEALVIAAGPGAEGRGGMLRYTNAIEPWRGKRVRLSARLKSEDVERLHLWLRVLGPAVTQHRHYDMADRPIRGTTDWQPYEIVMDVPEDAHFLNFGFYVEGGKGQAYADAVTLETVGPEVAVTPLAGIGRDGWQRRDDDVTRAAQAREAAVRRGAQAERLRAVARMKERARMDANDYRRNTVRDPRSIP